LIAPAATPPLSPFPTAAAYLAGQVLFAGADHHHVALVAQGEKAV
jgi:hypothetical protein